MAQLNSSVVQGSLRVTDTTYTTAAQLSILNAPTSSNGTVYGPGTADYVLMSNGASVYWGTGVTNALKALDVSTIGNTNGTKYIAAISQADGKISATAIDVATTYSATGTTAISGTGVAAAIGTLDSTLPSGSAASKTLTALTITDGKMTAATFSNIAIGAGQVTSGTLPVERGGTGIATASYKNAIIAGNASTVTNAFQAIRTNNGAFYATAQDGAPSFGTLPIAQGGTSTSGRADGEVLIGKSETSGSTTTNTLEWRVLKGSDLTTAIQYYTPTDVAPTPTTDVVPGTIWLRPTSVSIEDLKCLVVQLNNISGDGSQPVSATYNSASINRHMVVVGYSISNPAAVTGDLTWNTSDADPTLTVQGYINGNTNIILYLLPERGE